MHVADAFRQRLRQAWAEPSDPPPVYKPAHVQYVMIFSPRWTEHKEAEDPERLVGQLLMYTSTEGAVSHGQMTRQVAMANALIDFTASMHQHIHTLPTTNLRSLAIALATRRMYLLEVLPDLWMYTSIALAQWIDPTTATTAHARIVDTWMLQQMLDAWQGWRLEYDTPYTLLCTQGRASLESALERYFSKWVWTWDVEGQYAPTLHASPPATTPSGLVVETMPVLASYPGLTYDDIAQSLVWFMHASQAMETPAPWDMMLLYDDQLVWPMAHSPHQDDEKLSPHERRTIARYILSRLLGLDTARAKAATAFAKAPPTHRDERGRDPDISSDMDVSTTSIWPELPYMGDWLGQWSLDSLWPRTTSSSSSSSSATPLEQSTSSLSRPGMREARAPRSTDVLAEESRSQQRDEEGKEDEEDEDVSPSPRLPTTPTPQVPTHTSPSADQSPAATTTLHAFHARLEEALGESEPVPTVPATATVTTTVASKDPTASTRKEDAAQQLQGISQAYKALSTGRRSAPTTPHRLAASSSTSTSTTAAPAWYTSWRPSAVPPSTSHDYALDGWGLETPAPWHRMTLHVGGQDDVPLTAATPAALSTYPIQVAYMTRQLLTAVLVWRTPITDDEQDTWRAPTWEWMRRVQRVLNDVQRKAQHTEAAQAERPYLHVDTPTATAQNALRSPEPLTASMEAQLLQAQHWMQKHQVTSTLARAERRQFWIASRTAADAASHTFLVLRGAAQRDYGMAECDQHMRRLAAQHTEFGL